MDCMHVTFRRSLLLHARTCRLRARKEVQKKLGESLEAQLQEKLASQSGEVKALSDEAAGLRSELKTVAEETQVKIAFRFACCLWCYCV